MGWNLEGRCFFGIGAWFILLLPQSNFILFWKWFLHRRGSFVPANLLLWRDCASTSRFFGIVLWFGSFCSVCSLGCFYFVSPAIGCVIGCGWKGRGRQWKQGVHRKFWLFLFDFIDSMSLGLFYVDCDQWHFLSLESIVSLVGVVVY